MATPNPVKRLRATLRWPTAARKILAGRVTDVFSGEPGIRQGHDAEAVHGMRVALRRLEAAFRVFKACYPPKRLGRYQRRLQKLMKVLGAVRDHEIMSVVLSGHAKGSPEPVKECLERLAAQRRISRRLEHARVLRVMQKLQRTHFERKLLNFVSGAREVKGADSRAQFSTELAVAARRAIMSWNGRQKELQGSDDSDALHRMRIAAKRVRYTLELCRLADTRDYQGCVEHLANMQRVLGELHDADVLVRVLAESLATAPIAAIGGLADIIRVTKQERTGLAERFSRLISAGDLGPLKRVPAIRGEVRRSRSLRHRRAGVKT